MTTTTETTSIDIDYQLGHVDRLLARMADLLDAADHPGVHISAHYKPAMHVVWSSYDEWVRGCDWLSDIGADMTTGQIGASDILVIADAKVGNVDVTFSCMKRQA